MIGRSSPDALPVDGKLKKPYTDARNMVKEDIDTCTMHERGCEIILSGT